MPSILCVPAVLMRPLSHRSSSGQRLPLTATCHRNVAKLLSESYRAEDGESTLPSLRKNPNFASHPRYTRTNPRLPFVVPLLESRLNRNYRNVCSCITATTKNKPVESDAWFLGAPARTTA